MHSIQYVVSDLDDTLLGPGERVSSRSLQAAEALRGAGITLALASGRMIASMTPYMEALGVKEPFIACNGAQIADPQTQRPVYEDPIPLEILRELCADLEAEGCYFQIYEDDCFLYAEPSQYAGKYTAMTRARGRAVGRLSAYVHRPTPKLLIYAELPQADRLHARLEAAYGARLTVTRSKAEFVELTSKAATKGSALRRLMARWGASPEQVLAIGDGRNDISMFQEAGVSVAMGGALPEVVAAATFQTLSSAQDGFATFILEKLLAGTERGREVL